MDRWEKKELCALHEKIRNIAEKYKDKPRLYSRIKEVVKRLEYLHPVKPKPYRELAKLTAEIDFDCGFNDKGCKKYSHSKMCCCANCKEYIGHFQMKFFDYHDSEEYIEEELLYYTRKFSTKTGFWRKDKGCILPRERRSVTCLTYNCSDKHTKEEKLLLQILRNYGRIVKEYGSVPSYIPLITEILKDYFLSRKKN